MRRLRALLIRALSFLDRGHAEREFADELESHLQLHIDDNLRAGMTPDEARRAAIIRLGGVEPTRECYRDRQRLPLVDEAWRDLRYAARVLRKSPVFTATAVVTLALGIGANAAIFSVINAVLLRPLPFPDPDRLVMAFATSEARGERYDVASYPDYSDWNAGTRAFSGMAAYAGRTLTLNADGEAVLAAGKRMTASAFDVLGIRPVLGRVFRSDNQVKGASNVVVLSDGFWRRYYAGSPAALGGTLLIDDEPHLIIGVMPPSFHLDSDDEDFYVPLVPDPNRGHGFLRVIARLRPGRSVSEAQAELDVITARIREAQPSTNRGVGANVLPLSTALARDARPSLLIMFGVVGLVLAITCFNVAGLLLARGATRQREMAVRSALGAGRGRLARQLLTESMLLAVGGGALGLIVASWTSRGLVALMSMFHVPRLEATHTDARVLGFTLLLSLLTGVAFGVAPALAAASPDLNDFLRDATRSSTAARAPRLRGIFVVVEMALALVLLAAAGMLLRTFATLRSTPPGFGTQSVLTVDLWLPPQRFERLADRARFFDDALARVRSTPGVRSAAFVADLPLHGDSDGLGFHIVGRPDPTPDSMFSAGFNVATSDYFRTMDIPVTGGRGFTERDRAGSPGVVVINETAAKRFWPGESPIGKQITLPMSSDAPDEHGHDGSDPEKRLMTLTVVGVTGDVHHDDLGVPPRPEVFLSSMQAPLNWPWLVLVVRAAGEAETLGNPVKGAIRAADPNVPVSRTSTLEAVVSRSIAAPRIYALLVGIFAGLAVALAAIGLFGLVSYSVSERTHELGVRLALGAAGGQVARLVVGQGLRLAGLGAAFGLVLAWGVTRVLTTLSPLVKANDPLTFGAVTIVLLAVAAAATWLPARRAARVDPVIALRVE